MDPDDHGVSRCQSQWRRLLTGDRGTLSTLIASSGPKSPGSSGLKVRAKGEKDRDRQGSVSVTRHGDSGDSRPPVSVAPRARRHPDSVGTCDGERSGVRGPQRTRRVVDSRRVDPEPKIPGCVVDPVRAPQNTRGHGRPHPRHTSSDTSLVDPYGLLVRPHWSRHRPQRILGTLSGGDRYFPGLQSWVGDGDAGGSLWSLIYDRDPSSGLVSFDGLSGGTSRWGPEGQPVVARPPHRRPIPGRGPSTGLEVPGVGPELTSVPPSRNRSGPPASFFSGVETVAGVAVLPLLRRSEKPSRHHFRVVHGDRDPPVDAPRGLRLGRAGRLPRAGSGPWARSF